LGIKEKLRKKVSPPFEGGVVGMIDYLIHTVFYFPTGVVDSWIYSYLFASDPNSCFNEEILRFAGTSQARH
jgi:hypothetical protein